MFWQLAADLVLVLHALYVVFAVFGAVLALRWRWLIWLHVPAALWAAAVVIAGWLCPLTPLEQELRMLAGQQGYEGGFLEHYLLPLIYPPGLTRTVQFAMGAFVIAVNLILYTLVWRRWRN